MRGGWDDPMTHAHVAMLVTGFVAGLIVTTLAWVLAAALS